MIDPAPSPSRTCSRSPLSHASGRGAGLRPAEPATPGEAGGEGRQHRLTVCIAIGAVIFLLSACTVGPNYTRPTLDLPAGWRVDGVEAGEIANAPWWEAFHDPALTQLLSEAIAGSLDLKAAVARVDQARAQYGLARSALFPQITSDASGQRVRASRNTFQGIFIPSGQENYNNYDLDLSASYEIDLWGRLRRATEAARAQLLASEEGRRTVVLTLVTDLADAYIQLLALDDELAITQRTLDSRSEVLKLQKFRFEGGVAPESDMRQAESQYQIAAAAVPALQRQIVQQENLISVLAGRNPGPVKRGRTFSQLPFPPIPSGLPSDLLQRRPDVLQAEQSLIAANANIGVARAAYFPRISLTGLLGYQSEQLAQLFKGASFTWNAGAGLTQSVFTGGALQSQVELAQARQRELAASYQSAVISALRDVNDALIARATLEQQRGEQERNVKALNRLLELSQRRYQEGATIFLEVATAEQSLFDAEISLDTVRAQLFQSYADLYRAFGGGWIQTAEQLAPRASELSR